MRIGAESFKVRYCGLVSAHPVGDVLLSQAFFFPQMNQLLKQLVISFGESLAQPIIRAVGI
ncbi:hypothetical protein AWC06_08945 [Mycobacterium fragae]|uniref:Uncharacterized protein n=1 Tax=Mycobacterium fragae TaxID=1260918 RepID=A0A1X1V2Y3_9MYCO|nr:hypothetical protein AWC06_08945 [Mycobacterium fragae]